MEEKKYPAIEDAIVFASLKHAGQKRKDGSPYIYHPLHVAEMLKNSGYGINYQIAGILHDVLEDTDATEQEVAVFGDDVLNAVRLVTRPDGMDELLYVDNILKDPIATAVKNADKIHNLQEAVFSGPMDGKSKKACRFARMYVKKADKYYRGKFSQLLDDLIDECLKTVSPRV